MNSNAPDSPATDESTATADAEVDARGHRCPMPLLMAKRGLNTLNVGQVLKLLSTDPGSAKDFQIFARQSGNEILAAEDLGDEYHFLIRKV
ncbi:MAG: sulfurtransferase TusA family protein [Pseudomonadota bacterium]